ncbi:MAG: S8 family serine peptidase, partial [Paraclostridium sp.]
ISGLFDLEGTKYYIKYIYPTISSGQQETRVILENVKKGIWKIRLQGEYITNGIYHIYLPNKDFLKEGTKLIKADPYNTINSPAYYDETIAVGAYDTINDSLWVSSSRGYALSNTKKPAIVAPGVNIISSYPKNKYATITGTSVAAAHVTGAVALYLQYALVDENYTNRSYVQQIRSYLKLGATRKDSIAYPNREYGYGLLNIKGMFFELR